MSSRKESQAVVDRLFNALGEADFSGLLAKISHGADLNIPCSLTGDTLLKAAVQDEHFDAIPDLIAAGADPNQDLGGISPIQRATLFHQDDLVSAMREQRRRYESALGRPAA